jgi:glycosyltransferase involved in cell wall biosynthesis
MAVLVSVVIPMHNAGPIVSETIDSCLSQTLQDHEIVLVNNNASSETLAAIHPYLSRYPGKVRMVLEPKQGACSARNRGILEAKGKYVALLDDDDLMHADRLQRQLALAEQHPEAALVYTLFDRVSQDNKRVICPSEGGTPEYWRALLFEPGSRLARTPTVFPTVMFFKRETALTAGLFDERFNPQGFEETEFCLRMSEQGPFVGIDEPLVRYRARPHAHWVRQKQILHVIIRNLDLFYRILMVQYGSTHSRRRRKAFRKMRGQWLREVSLMLFPFTCGRSLGIYLLRRSLAENPFDAKTWKMWVRSFYPKCLWPSAFHFPEWIHDPVPPEVNRKFLENIFLRSLGS